jgi:RNA polymerase sigma-70 factor (ECF subfamily)
VPGAGSGVSIYVPTQTENFEEFYEASYRRVVAVVAAIAGDRHQAEDIAQEAFSRALTRWHRIARYELPEAWVRRVALRLTVDAARRTRRAKIMSVLLAVGQRGAYGDRYDLRDPLEATALSVALMRLPLPQRQVLVLYYLADLPVDDIARDCGISVGTVRNRLTAARRRLHDELAESDFPESGLEVPHAR